MSKRNSRHGLKVGSKVWVNIDDGWADLLEDMGLVDQNGDLLSGIRMQDTIEGKSKNKYQVHLCAAEESFGFLHEKTFQLRDLTQPPVCYVVVKNNIVCVRGLVFTKDNRPDTYHLTRKDAEAELKGAKNPPRSSGRGSTVSTEGQSTDISKNNANNVSSGPQSQQEKTAQTVPQQQGKNHAELRHQPSPLIPRLCNIIINPPNCDADAQSAPSDVSASTAPEVTTSISTASR